MNEFESIGVFVIAVFVYVIATLGLGCLFSNEYDSDDTIVILGYVLGVIIFGITIVLNYNGVI